MEELRVIVGRQLRLRRKETGMTMQQLSAAAGVSVSHLSKIERGEINVTLGTIEKMLRALQIEEIDELWR